MNRLKKMIVWALFDSGNGSYTKVIKTLNEAKEANIDVYPIGIDIEHKNSHFIELDLADYKRLFGDNTLFNTIEIIKRYEPSYFIIENPASGRIWKYIEDVMGFKLPYLNMTRYNNYDYPLQKPTKFASNLFLNLNNEVKSSKVEWKYFSRSYNERSNIPQKLLLDIFKTVIKHFEEFANGK